MREEPGLIGIPRRIGSTGQGISYSRLVLTCATAYTDHMHERTTAREWAKTIIAALPPECVPKGYQNQLEALWLRSQNMRWTTAETASAYVQGSAASLGIPLKQFLELALRTPSLFNARPERLMERADGLQTALRLSSAALKRLVVSQPVVLTRNPDAFAEKLQMLAQALGVTKDKARSMCRRTPSLLGYTRETIERRITCFETTFGMSNSAVMRNLRRWPELITNSDQRIERFAPALAALSGMSEEQARGIVRKHVRILSVTPERAAGNLKRLAALLDISEPQVWHLAARFPAIVYLRPAGIHATLGTVATKLDVELGAVVKSALLCPTLVARKPGPMVQKIRLTVRIARALGREIDARRVLASFPAAPTYAMDRLLVRYWMARNGIGGQDWQKLVRMRDDVAIEVIRSFGLKVGTSARERAEQIIADRIV